MTKCSCEMTGLEILEDTLRIAQPQRTILIVDHGHGWTVTAFGPTSAGDPAPQQYSTVQAVLERVETLVVDLRRQPETSGYVITNPKKILRAFQGE